MKIIKDGFNFIIRRYFFDLWICGDWGCGNNGETSGYLLCDVHNHIQNQSSQLTGQIYDSQKSY